jgi:hypothetical protein
VNLGDRLLAGVLREHGAALGHPYGKGQQIHRTRRIGHAGIVSNDR